MTPEQIAALTAGPETDVLVAEHLPQEWQERLGLFKRNDVTKFLGWPKWSPSTDLNAAHEMEAALPEALRVEYIQRLNWFVGEHTETPWLTVHASALDRVKAFLTVMQQANLDAPPPA